MGQMLRPAQCLQAGLGTETLGDIVCKVRCEKSIKYHRYLIGVSLEDTSDIRCVHVTFIIGHTQKQAVLLIKSDKTCVSYALQSRSRAS